MGNKDMDKTPKDKESKTPSANLQASTTPAGTVNAEWSGFQDEREIKRKRRKQSNRESARRSRLHKQVECNELAQHAAVLKEENATLRLEVSQIRSEYERLLAENASLKERLGEAPSNEDVRAGGNEQHLSNDAQEPGMVNVVKDGA